uniref:Serpentine receptor class gamma n=1 Tax=Panagrellus redivivus TaxID=6233 RepID=A0A7E4VCS5_PANRE
MGHTVIAYNRYQVIKYIGQPRRKWPKLKARAFVIAMCIIPFCMYAYRFPFEICYHFTDVGYSVTFSDSRMQRIVSIVNLTYYTINVTLSVIFTILTYIGCQSVQKSRATMNFTEKNEIKLYIYSAFTVLCLLGRFGYEWVVLSASLANATVLIGYAQRCLPFLAAFYALSGTPFLLLCSQRIRKDYCVFYGIHKYISSMNNTNNNITVVRSSFATVSPTVKFAPGAAWTTGASK